jgi:hypothetical protein
MRCYSEIYTKLEDLNLHIPIQTRKIPCKIEMQYMEVMNEKLLNFWATHRFTPNQYASECADIGFELYS